MFLPFFTEWCDMLVHILADFLLELAMGIVVVRAVLAVEPQRVGERHV